MATALTLQAFTAALRSGTKAAIGLRAFDEVERRKRRLPGMSASAFMPNWRGSMIRIPQAPSLVARRSQTVAMVVIP
jgi:hypothetical protein